MYRRPNERCPAKEFIDRCTNDFKRKFKGAFDAITQQGSKYVNHQRFRPLTGAGKPLWEFKEHDHRLYCCRECTGDYMRIVLLSGCVKQKEGKSKEEDSEIKTAKRLYEEYLNLKERKNPK